MAFRFSVMGFPILIIAVLIVMNPDSMACFIAAFLLLYEVSNLIKLFQNPKDRSGLVQ